MTKKSNQTHGHYGILFTTFLITLSIVSSAPATEIPVNPAEVNPDVSPGKAGRGASPAHAIPVNPAEVESWFAKTIIHAK